MFLDGRMRGFASMALVSLAAVAAGCATVGVPDSVVAAELYETATVDPGGGLRIVTVDGRTIRIPPDRERVYDRRHRSASDLVISPDRTAVGAVARYGDEAYPMVLFVYSRGTLHRFRADPMIWEWRFDDNGSRVAYKQSPLHLTTFEDFELRDVESERLIDSFGRQDVWSGPGDGCCEPGVGWRDGTLVPMPDWVKRFESQR